MPEPSKKIVPSGNFIHELAIRIKLIIRLMADRRVNPLLKALPVATILYMFNPIDIPGPLDDAAVMGLGIYLFLELCPPNVVQEHLNQLRGINLESEPLQPEDIVDAEFREEEEP